MEYCPKERQNWRSPRLYRMNTFFHEILHDDWNQKVQQAKLEINDREEKVAKEDEKIEHDLELVGSTAIEDRLQDEVKDTVEFMRRANIKVWVLTGDKVETAINIGISAGLLD